MHISNQSLFWSMGGLLCSIRGKEVMHVYLEWGETQTTTFQYAKLIEWHFHYHHTIDNWQPQQSPSCHSKHQGDMANRLLAGHCLFFSSVSNINTYLALTGGAAWSRILPIWRLRYRTYLRENCYYCLYPFSSWNIGDWRYYFGVIVDFNVPVPD